MGRAQEKAPVFRSERRRDAEGGISILQAEFSLTQVLDLDSTFTASPAQVLYADLETSLNISGPFGAASPAG